MRSPFLSFFFIISLVLLLSFFLASPSLCDEKEEKHTVIVGLKNLQRSVSIAQHLASIVFVIPSSSSFSSSSSSSPILRRITVIQEKVEDNADEKASSSSSSSSSSDLVQSVLLGKNYIELGTSNSILLRNETLQEQSFLEIIQEFLTDSSVRKTSSSSSSSFSSHHHSRFSSPTITINNRNLPFLSLVDETYSTSYFDLDGSIVEGIDVETMRFAFQNVLERLEKRQTENESKKKSLFMILQNDLKVFSEFIALGMKRDNSFDPVARGLNKRLFEMFLSQFVEFPLQARSRDIPLAGELSDKISFNRSEFVLVGVNDGLTAVISYLTSTKLRSASAADVQLDFKPNYHFQEANFNQETNLYSVKIRNSASSKSKQQHEGEEIVLRDVENVFPKEVLTVTQKSKAATSTMTSIALCWNESKNNNHDDDPATTLFFGSSFFAGGPTEQQQIDEKNNDNNHHSNDQEEGDRDEDDNNNNNNVLEANIRDLRDYVFSGGRNAKGFEKLEENFFKLLETRLQKQYRKSGGSRKNNNNNRNVIQDAVMMKFSSTCPAIVGEGGDETEEEEEGYFFQEEDEKTNIFLNRFKNITARIGGGGGGGGKEGDTKNKKAADDLKRRKIKFPRTCAAIRILNLYRISKFSQPCLRVDLLQEGDFDVFQEFRQQREQRPSSTSSSAPPQYDDPAVLFALYELSKMFSPSVCRARNSERFQIWKDIKKKELGKRKKAREEDLRRNGQEGEDSESFSTLEHDFTIVSSLVEKFFLRRRVCPKVLFPVPGRVDIKIHRF